MIEHKHTKLNRLNKKIIFLLGSLCVLFSSFSYSQVQGDTYSVGKVVTGDAATTYTVPYTVTPANTGGSSFTANTTGGGTITLGNGQTLTVSNLPTTVQDAAGTVYQADDKGKLTKVGTNSSNAGAMLATANLTVVDASKGTVTFAPTSDMKYAFDAWQKAYDGNSTWSKRYETLPLSGGAKGGSYRVSSKLMVPGEADKVLAIINLNDKHLVADSVRFVNAKGTLYERKKITDNSCELSLVGGPAGDAQEVYALYSTGGKTYTLGKLLVATYEPKTINLALVPVNDAPLDSKAIAAELKKIYEPLGIDFNLITKDNFKYKALETASLKVEGSGLLSVYTDQMKALNAAFVAKGDCDKNTIYLFAIDQPESQDGKSIEGVMARGQQFGYMFVKGKEGDEQGLTAAHEIGHGIFQLQHTFSYSGMADATFSAANVMNYPAGETLSKLQWDLMHDQGLVISVFETDKGAESSAVWQENLKRLQATLLQIGENGCAFVRKQTSVSTNKEQNTSVTTTSIDYLVGKYKNTQLAFDAGLGNETTTEFSKGIRLLLESDNKNWILYVVNGSIEACEAKEDYSSFGSLSTAKSDPVFLNKCKTDLLNCKVDENTYIKNVLSQLQSNARSNQTIEFSYNNKSYTLKDNNIQQIELSDDDINGGNWTDINVDARFRYEVNSNGIIQLKAFGYRNNLAIAKGKSADLKEISTHILQQTNKYLQENKVIDFSQIAPDVNTDLFADGKKIEIGNNSSFFKIISEGVGVVTTLLKTAEIEKPIYLESTENNTTIHAPGIVTGSTEVIAQKVTGLTSLATGIYDLVTDAETRSNVYNGLVQVKDAIGNDPTAFVPIMVNVISSVATGNSIPEWQEVNNSQTDAGRRSHLGTRGVGNTLITAFATAAFIKELPEIAEKVSEKINIVKYLTKWDELTSDEIKQLFKSLSHSDLKVSSSEQFGAATANKNFKLEYITDHIDYENFIPPYKKGTFVDKISLKEDAFFVRVHYGKNEVGQWMMTIEDYKALIKDPSKFKEVYALPEMPTKASLVKVPQGTTIWRGEAADNKWGIGGGIQIQIDNWSQYIDERKLWFKLVDKL